ncbi:SH3 domain-containing protein 19 [Lutzomyia longipalpis]|uniref:Putative sorbin and sh3 domain-containing protein n=1 Tax=Lutzomyia longipalpis TaxID=7200 RepID=A0A7G3AYY7_LUTLO|nr:SH3 domain-containing protein 19 [Lutzomyia longipalpis]
MTIPSRPAPAPPQQRSSGASQLRYTPTTDWDDSPFDMAANVAAGVSHAGSVGNGRKIPPPRPPPPKSTKPPLKKSGQPQSVNILSNLFGATGRRAKTPPTGSAAGPHIGALKLPPPKIQPPPASTRNQSATSSTDVQLIDFNSPPSSPTFTQKSNSDCVSVDSFSSDSNYSPNNGHSSQAESGFEDDFASADVLQTNRDAWGDTSDPFTSPPVCQNYVGPKIRPPVAQKPVVLAGSSSFYSLNSSGSHHAKGAAGSTTTKFDDPLCNGKTLVAPTPSIAAPTIIKPTIAPKPIMGLAGSRTNVGQSVMKMKEVFQQENSNSLDDPCPSPPMPTCPPPPPPPAFYLDDTDETESYGIALYNFETEEVGDLNFRENEKIYLLRQIDTEWMYGRNKRGCEGMFPINFIEIRVPLKEEKSKTQQITTTNGPVAKQSAPIANTSRKARVLYDFTAEVPEDLTLREGEIVNVLHEINSEWMYGECRSRTGQFPANFVEFI